MRNTQPGKDRRDLYSGGSENLQEKHPRGFEEEGRLSENKKPRGYLDKGKWRTAATEGYKRHQDQKRR